MIMTIFILSNYHQHIYFQKALAILCKNLWLTFFISAVVCVKWQFKERIPIFLLPVWRLVLMIFSLPAILRTCHMLSITLIHISEKNQGYSPKHSKDILSFLRLTFIFRHLRVPRSAEASSCWPCCSWRADRKKEIKGKGEETPQRALQFCSHLVTCSRKTFAIPERSGVNTQNLGF